MRYNLWLMALLLGGCGDMTSSPVPQPVPGAIRISTPGKTKPTTLVVGLAGAVAGAGQVEVRNTTSGTTATSPASPGGSFAVTLAAGRNDGLEARYRDPAGALSDPVPLRDRMQTLGPGLGPPTGPDVVSAPDAQGRSTVTNDAGAGNPLLIDVPPQSTVLVSNEDNAAVVQTRADGGGRFTATIAAATGHTIHIMLVDPADPTATSDFLTFPVP